MPTREQVDWAAEKVLAAGGRVSLRTVIAALKAGPARGGSFREVGPLLRDWKAEKAYRPRLVPAGLPERLQGVLGKAAAEMWEAAQAEAAAALLVERENLEARARAGDELLEESARAARRGGSRGGPLAGAGPAAGEPAGAGSLRGVSGTG